MKRAWLCMVLVACGAPPSASNEDAGVLKPEDPWADRVVRFSPGPGAGFGADALPQVVLGPPQGAGATQGSLDVLSLGNQGVIELEFDDLLAIDGPGVDLLVFENGFTGFFELGNVAVSDDGLNWHELRCCAGQHPVFANPAQGISGIDPAVAGGDGFDLSGVGVEQVRFVRITDSGTNRFYAPPGGGFDLDAVAVVNARRVGGDTP